MCTHTVCFENQNFSNYFFSIFFYSDINLCILHGQVFVMVLIAHSCIYYVEQFGSQGHGWQDP